MTYIELSGGNLDDVVVYYRCDFTDASAPVKTLSEDGYWVPTPYQCADCRHRESGLIKLAKKLEAHAWSQACGMPAEKFHCRASVGKLIGAKPGQL
jgi:hypothetical protein